MGKQGSPRSPRPKFESDDMFSSIVKDNQVRTLEGLLGNDPLPGRRMSWGDHQWNRSLFLNGIKSDPAKCGSFRGGVYMGKRKIWMRKHVRNVVLMIAMMGVIFMLDSFMVSVFDSTYTLQNSTSMKSYMLKEEKNVELKDKKPPVMMYSRLLDLASRSLAEKEFQLESSSLWKESYHQASRWNWKPCADKKVLQGTGKTAKTNGYLLVSANGGLNQQRVAICNAVAVASLLNATLVLPKFLYSTVWKDPSQFGDIYHEDLFIKTLKDEVDIVKELPSYLRSIDVEAIGSQITDADIEKEAMPVDFIRIVYPLLVKNGLVHLLGFGNRLGFDPVPSNLQKLRCKCNFHALKFSPKIQRAGALLVRRLRKYNVARNTLDKKLLGKFIPSLPIISNNVARGIPKYLALHLRFEEDMVAYSRCDFGGGEDERKELQAYREKHFPLVLDRLKHSKQVSATKLRNMGRCPLTPEEAALVLAGIGFNRRTYIYLAGSHIYGGRSRMQPFTSLYPNLVTKETLLTPNELSPFKNFSSQLAALDFIACTTADVFAMTDSGSQLSSLVSGFRNYYGGGRAPTLRPSKKRLAAILSENRTIEWNIFEDRIRKMIEEGQRVHVRRFGKSIYRNPMCPECMCKIH